MQGADVVWRARARGAVGARRGSRRHGATATRCGRGRQTRVLGTVATGVALALTTTCAAPPPIADSGYELVFHEPFDGDAVRPHWATAPFGGSLPGTVEEGLLTLRSTADNEHRWAYIASTGPRTDMEPSYPFASAWEEGYFEARLRYTDDPWAWPAFWLFSMAKTEAWPGEDCRTLNAEWDIMENGIQNVDGSRPATHWSFTALHRNTTDGTSDGYCGIRDVQRTYGEHHPDKDLSDWHVWAGHWTEDEVCTYLDDVELTCMELYDSTHQPMHIVFSIDYLNRCIGCPPRPPELMMQVDWVRVWQ